MHQISQRKKNHEQIHVTPIKTDESLVVLFTSSVSEPKTKFSLLRDIFQYETDGYLSLCRLKHLFPPSYDNNNHGNHL